MSERQHFDNDNRDLRGTVASISAIVACVAFIASFFLTSGWIWGTLLGLGLIAQTVSLIAINNADYYQYEASKGLLALLIVLHVLGIIIVGEPHYLMFGILGALLFWGLKD